jgi:hypothetical protein
MSSGNGQPRQYHVSMSQVQRARLLQLRQEQDALGRGPRFVAAFREIIRRLQRDPLVFGEELFTLPIAQLNVRTAAIHPIVVDYAVHEERKLVFIRGFKVMS